MTDDEARARSGLEQIEGEAPVLTIGALSVPAWKVPGTVWYQRWQEARREYRRLRGITTGSRR